MTTFTLACQNLSIGYKTAKTSDPTILQENINISIKTGELTCLLGINGSGKSTLIKTLTQSIPALKGHIYINNLPLENYTKQHIAKLISIVLTERILVDNLSVYELVKIGRTPYLSWQGSLTHQDNQSIERAIEQTNIESLLYKNIHTLSDGQMQRVLIARALAQDTPIIILDEPSNHLDFHHKVSLYLLLKDLAKKQNKAILFSSHDMELALQFSDNAIVFKKDFNKQDTIDNLVNNNVFADFFNHPTINFEKANKRFNVTL